jgi:hypothetical protein
VKAVSDQLSVVSFNLELIADSSSTFAPLREKSDAGFRVL